MIEINDISQVPKRLLRRYGFFHLPKRLRVKIIREIDEQVVQIDRNIAAREAEGAVYPKELPV
jgi:hypothetical protein